MGVPPGHCHRKNVLGGPEKICLQSSQINRKSLFLREGGLLSFFQGLKVKVFNSTFICSKILFAQIQVAMLGMKQ
jgi:hypothetical protein